MEGGGGWVARTPTLYFTLHLNCLFQLPHVVVNCVESFSSRLIYEHILTKLQDDGQNPVAPRCDNMTDFVRMLRQSITAQGFQNETFYIVLDKAERLRDMEANILPAFLRFQELSKMNITVIMASEIIWEKFQFGTGFREPILVHFPDYSKLELLQILVRDCPEEYPKEFYSAYCQLLLSIFYAVCRDLKELRHLVSCAGYYSDEDLKTIYCTVFPQISAILWLTLSLLSSKSVFSQPFKRRLYEWCHENL